jgi:hypothetical protein
MLGELLLREGLLGLGKLGLGLLGKLHAIRVIECASSELLVLRCETGELLRGMVLLLWVLMLELM